jgi:hypothetical protein
MKSEIDSEWLILDECCLKVFEQEIEGLQREGQGSKEDGKDGEGKEGSGKDGSNKPKGISTLNLNL